MLLGAVVGTERFQLGLPFAQLRQNFVLRVLCRAVLRFQQALGDQLLLDAALQGLGMWHTAGKGSAQLKGQPARGTALRCPRLVNTFLSLWALPLYLSTHKNIETDTSGLVVNIRNTYRYAM